MADVKNAYPASADLTFTSLASLATSSTFLAGAESALYDNTSSLYRDVRLSGKIVVGTSPTTSTEIRVYVVAEQKDGTWPDVIDGSDSAKTWTSAGIRDAAAVLAIAIRVDATTSDREYAFDAGSVAALFGGVLPRKFVVFVAHNTAVNLKSSGSVVSVSPVYETIA